MGRARLYVACLAVVIASGAAAARWPRLPRRTPEAIATPDAPAVETSDPPFLVAEPELPAGTGNRREGIGATLTGRLVRTGERIVSSPYAAWTKAVRTITAPGVEVIVWSAGSAPSGDPQAVLLPHLEDGRVEMAWILASRSGAFTSVLPIHESPALFRRADHDCSDETELVDAKPLRLGDRALLWIELHERWSCLYNGNTSLIPERDVLPEPTGPLERDRRTGALVLVEPDGQLRRLAFGIPLADPFGTGAPRANGTLTVTFGPAPTLVVSEGPAGATASQRRWIGKHDIEPLARRAAAVPSPVDEPLAEGDVSPSCADPLAEGTLAIEVDAPASLTPWRMNPDVLVLAVPGGGGRLALRAITRGADGIRTDVTGDACVRFQPVGNGVRALERRGDIEVSFATGQWILAFLRGQRRILRLEAVPPPAPALPGNAAELIARKFPGMRLPTLADCPGWNFYWTGPGLEIGDLDRDGRPDLAALLIDRNAWKLAILHQAANGGYELAFTDGSARRRDPETGSDPAIALRRTSAGDLIVHISHPGRPRAEDWIVRWRGDRFERLTLPALRVVAEYIVPHVPPIDPDVGAPDEMARALFAGDAEAFAAAAPLDASRKERIAAALVELLRTSPGDRTRGFAGLALLGEPAGSVAVPLLSDLFFPKGGPSARRLWRSPNEATAASVAFERMGAPALRVLVDHLSDNSAGLMAEAIVRDHPELRALVASKARRTDGRYHQYAAMALRSAPLESDADLDDALAMMREGVFLGETAVPRIEAAAREPRTPERDALLRRAVPALAERLSISRPDVVASTPAAEAGYALARIGRPGEQALPSLEVALRDPACATRAAARYAIAAIRGQAPRTFDSRGAVAVECPTMLLPAAAKGGSTPPTRAPTYVPDRMLVIRSVSAVGGGDTRFGFEPPFPIDWTALGRQKIPGLEFGDGGEVRGPMVERLRRREEDESSEARGTTTIRFDAPLPAPLSRLSYYVVAASGVRPTTPAGLIGFAHIAAPVSSAATVQFYGYVSAGVDEGGFVLVSDVPLEIERKGDAAALAARWSMIISRERLARGEDVRTPRGFVFTVRARGRVEEYMLAILPPDPTNCADRQRLFRVVGNELRIVGLLDANCDV